jgi:CRP-like cAMP-binding protein
MSTEQGTDDVLDWVPYFRPLRPDERTRIAGRVRHVQLGTGETYALSAQAPALVIVERGVLSISRGGEAAQLFVGDSVGDAEVLAGTGAAEVLTATEPSVLAVLERAEVDALLREYPITARPWVAELGRALKWRNDVLREVLLARSEGWRPEQLAAMLKRRRGKLQRRRHHPVRGVGALLWRVLLVEPARRPTFWMFAGLVLALASARTVVAMILRNGLQRHLFALIGSAEGNPIHVHHFNYGLILISAVGLVSLLPRMRRALRALSFVFGFGMGLVVDEFSLLWNLNPDYYQPGSRLVAGLVIFGFMQVVYFRALYVSIARRLLAGLSA